MYTAGTHSECYVEDITSFGLPHLVFLVGIYRNVEGFCYTVMVKVK